MGSGWGSWVQGGVCEMGQRGFYLSFESLGGLFLHEGRHGGLALLVTPAPRDRNVRLVRRPQRSAKVRPLLQHTSLSFARYPDNVEAQGRLIGGVGSVLYEVEVEGVPCCARLGMRLRESPACCAPTHVGAGRGRHSQQKARQDGMDRGGANKAKEGCCSCVALTGWRCACASNAADVMRRKGASNPATEEHGGTAGWDCERNRVCAVSRTCCG